MTNGAWKTLVSVAQKWSNGKQQIAGVKFKIFPWLAMLGKQWYLLLKNDLNLHKWPCVVSAWPWSKGTSSHQGRMAAVSQVWRWCFPTSYPGELWYINSIQLSIFLWNITLICILLPNNNPIIQIVNCENRHQNCITVLTDILECKLLPRLFFINFIQLRLWYEKLFEQQLVINDFIFTLEN